MMGKFPRKITMFICPECEEHHEIENDAEKCCPRDEIEEVEDWQCIECDEVHEEREDAYSCCD